MIRPVRSQHCPPFDPLTLPRGLLLAVAFLLGLLLTPTQPLQAQIVEFEDLDPTETYPTSLDIPVDGITIDDLNNTWGNPRSRGRHHEGIDIFAPRNTPVRAVTDGIIYSKGVRGIAGRMIMILDPLGYLHLYAHLESYGTQQQRERIYRGDIIGYVGNSGNAAGGSCHLHYGISDPDRKWINPYWVLAHRSLDEVLEEQQAGYAELSAGSALADHAENSGSH